MVSIPNDLDKARRKRRDRDGWTLEEIKKKAEDELKRYKEVVENEPSGLVSGDMDKIIRGEDKDE